MRRLRQDTVVEVIKLHYGPDIPYDLSGSERGTGRSDAWVYISGINKPPALVEVKEWYDRIREGQKRWSDCYFKAHGIYPLILYRDIRGKTHLFNSYIEFINNLSKFQKNHRATDEEIDYIMMHVEDGAESIAKALGRTVASVHGLVRLRAIRIRSIHDWKPKEDETLIQHVNEGKSITEASLHLKRNRSVVRLRAKVLGIKFKSYQGWRGPRVKVSVKKITYLYFIKKLGLGLISKQLGVSIPVIANRIRKEGLALRPLGTNQYTKI